jgi:hypothetical protein
MGHKVNAFSFRIRKNWDSLYFFKNKNILNNFIIQDIQLREYISQVCFHQKKIVYNFKIFRCSNSLFIFFKYLSFFKNIKKKFQRSRFKHNNKFKKLYLKKNKNFLQQKSKKFENINKINFKLPSKINLNKFNDLILNNKNNKLLNKYIKLFYLNKLNKEKNLINIKFKRYKSLYSIKNLKKHLSINICNFFNIKKVFIFCFNSKFPKKRNFKFINFFFKKELYRQNFINISSLVLLSFINKSAKVLSLGISEMFKKLIKHNQFLRVLSRILFIYYKYF